MLGSIGDSIRHQHGRICSQAKRHEAVVAFSSRTQRSLHTAVLRLFKKQNAIARPKTFLMPSLCFPSQHVFLRAQAEGAEFRGHQHFQLALAPCGCPAGELSPRAAGELLTCPKALPS